MKKERTKLRKLTLSRETLHPLETHQLQDALGGVAATTSRLCADQTTFNC